MISTLISVKATFLHYSYTLFTLKITYNEITFNRNRSKSLILIYILLMREIIIINLMFQNHKAQPLHPKFLLKSLVYYIA
jgi:hypothetical protein